MPDIIPAIPGLLQHFDARIRQEAERLVDDDAVRGLDVFEDEALAEVRLDDRSVNVRWARQDLAWDGETDADDSALHDLALCTTLVAIHRRAARQPQAAAKPDEPPEESFQSIIERRAARQLTPDEEAYLAKLEKRFQRVRQSGQIFDQDMVRLHPKWGIESLDPLPLWPEPPTNLREFWDYIALALHEKNLAIPSFLRGVADLDATRERLREWRQQRSVPLWKERIRRMVHEFAEHPGTHRLACDFRLMITTAEARLQVCLGEDDVFHPVSPVEAAQLAENHERGALILPAPAELLFVSCLTQNNSGVAEPFRLDNTPNARWLGTLFHQADLHERLVTLDAAPFRWFEQPLVWQGIEDEFGNTLRVALVAETTEPVPLPLRVLHGIETLYLSTDMVFRGPSWFPDESRIDAPIDVPLAALSTQDGITFLQQLGIPLPASLAKRVRHESLDVEIRANCLARSPLSGAEFALFKVQARGPDGKVREALRATGWEPLRDESDAVDDAIVCRDREALGVAEAKLQELRPIYDQEHDGFRVRLTKNFPDQFNGWALTLPQGTELSTDDRLQSILADPLVARVKIEAAQTSSIDWFDLRMVFEIEGADLKPAEIRRLVAAKGGYVQLADGTWRRVKLELTEEQQVMIDQLGLDLEGFGDEAHRLHWRQLAGQTTREIINPRAWQNITQRMETARLDERPPVPDGLNASLRPYQVQGFHFLTYLSLNKFGGILADDMGLGKTIQSIAWILWLRSRFRNPWPTLVVCPKSVLDVWALEFSKCASQLRVQVLHDKDELDLVRLHDDFDVLVLNYAQLRGCIEQLDAVRWLAVILDEGQQIKNPDSKAAKAARQLRAENRLVLTGTPLENRLLDLWSLMTFATPGALGDRSYFHRHFDRRKDAQASTRLSSRLKPFLLRRTKAEVAKDLPLRSEESLLCEMSGEQERLYREELARAQQMVLTASGFEVLTRRRFAILQALTRLRQICCHPSLVDKSTNDQESAKFTATLELIEELHAEGHKVLLFSQFVTMLNIIREKLEEMKVPYYWLTGSTTNRAEVVRGFQEDEDACVFLLSLKAGGSGLNLTAASYVILYDPWWNPAVEAQAIDRAHRIGQTQPVMAYRMITKGTIEEKIMLLQEKKNLMSANILGEGGFARTLEKADFEFLFDIEAQAALELEK